MTNKENDYKASFLEQAYSAGYKAGIIGEDMTIPMKYEMWLDMSGAPVDAPIAAFERFKSGHDKALMFLYEQELVQEIAEMSDGEFSENCEKYFYRREKNDGSVDDDWVRCDSNDAIDGLNKTIDNPSFDGTEWAHPAWWRGYDYAVDELIMSSKTQELSEVSPVVAELIIYKQMVGHLEQLLERYSKTDSGNFLSKELSKYKSKFNP